MVIFVKNAKEVIRVSKDSDTTVDYVEIRSSDGGARILRGVKAQEFFEDMVSSFYRDFRLGFKVRDHKWEHVHFKEEQGCKIKTVK